MRMRNKAAHAVEVASEKKKNGIQTNEQIDGSPSFDDVSSSLIVNG